MVWYNVVMKNTESATATVKILTDERGKFSYTCLTCGKVIKFWGTIHNHMAAHGLKVQS